jgi:hypothetical protein
VSERPFESSLAVGPHFQKYVPVVRGNVPTDKSVDISELNFPSCYTFELSARVDFLLDIKIRLIRTDLPHPLIYL